jgi:iron complex transport system substrate-binding protein
MSKKIVALVSIFLIIGGAIYFTQISEKPVQIADSGKSIIDLEGRETVFITPCQRTVLMKSSDIYELSLILGEDAPEKIAAWGPDLKNSDLDAYEKFTEKFTVLKEKPVLGDIAKDAVNPEDVLSYNPDLILMDSYMIRRHLKIVDKLKAADAPMVFLNQSYDALENPQKGISVLGQLFNQETRAQEINSYINAQIEIVTSRLAKKIKKEKPVVYIESGNSGAQKYGQTYGEDGVHKLHNWGAQILLAGGANVIDYKLGESIYIDPEFLFKKDPDIIIITGGNWPATEGSMRTGFYATGQQTQQLLKNYANRPGWQDLKAVKNGNVYAIHSGCVGHSFNFFALQQMAKWFYPEEFADVNPEENLKEFYRRFMPVEYSGIWSAQLNQ